MSKSNNESLVQGVSVLEISTEKPNVPTETTNVGDSFAELLDAAGLATPVGFCKYICNELKQFQKLVISKHFDVITGKHATPSKETIKGEIDKVRCIIKDTTYLQKSYDCASQNDTILLSDSDVEVIVSDILLTAANKLRKVHKENSAVAGLWSWLKDCSTVAGDVIHQMTDKSEKQFEEIARKLRQLMEESKTQIDDIKEYKDLCIFEDTTDELLKDAIDRILKNYDDLGQKILDFQVEYGELTDTIYTEVVTELVKFTWRLLKTPPKKVGEVITCTGQTLLDIAKPCNAVVSIMKGLLVAVPLNQLLMDDEWMIPKLKQLSATKYNLDDRLLKQEQKWAKLNKYRNRAKVWIEKSSKGEHKEVVELEGEDSEEEKDTAV